MTDQTAAGPMIAVPQDALMALLNALDGGPACDLHRGIESNPDPTWCFSCHEAWPCYGEVVRQCIAGFVQAAGLPDTLDHDAVAAEREACAELVAGIKANPHYPLPKSDRDTLLRVIGWEDACDVIVAAIRNRGEADRD